MKKSQTKTEKISKKELEISKAKSLLLKNGISVAESGEVVVDQMTQDFRSSVIILSVAVNMVVFLTWLILNITTKYDTALIQALLQR
ncbi:MAG: hypothetical protein Q4A21_00980 [bacterium]|nr:hypothetical protein [bacterium]